jgi:acyl-coenzyme A synthetase/AMP-(fatty) acid ligase
MDEDGYLYIVGRSAGMVKVSDFKVSPREIKDALFGIRVYLKPSL